MAILGHQVLPGVEFGQVPLWRQILRGFSQLAFQVNEVTSLFFIAAVALYSLRLAAFLVIGVVTGTLVAKLAGGIGDLLDLGLYGFNPGLMGLAMGTFFVHEPIMWLWVPVMAAVVSLFSVVLSKHLPFPYLASPFILTFWVFYALSGALGVEVGPLLPFSDTDVLWVESALVAIGGAVFANAALSGLVFLTGLAISNWRHAVIAFLAVFIAHWVAFQGQVAPGAINAGIIGFNAVLASIAAYSLLGEDLRLTLLAAVGATILIRVFNLIGVIPLAAGFVSIIWIILLLEWLNPRFRGEPSNDAEEHALLHEGGMGEGGEPASG